MIDFVRGGVLLDSGTCSLLVFFCSFFGVVGEIRKVALRGTSVSVLGGKNCGREERGYGVSVKRSRRPFCCLPLVVVTVTHLSFF